MTAPLPPRPGAPAWSRVDNGSSSGTGWKVRGCTFHNGPIPVGVAVGSITEPTPVPQPRRLRRHTAEPLAVGLVVEDGSARFVGRLFCEPEIRVSARMCWDRWGRR